MTAVAHMTNEIRQMLYNFGYKTRFEEIPGDGCVCSLHQVEGNREITGKADSTHFDAIIQAYL